MNKLYRFFVMIVLLLAALLLIAGTSAAERAESPYRYTTFMAKCAEYPPEEVWETDQVLHIRGLITTGQTFGDPYFAGTFENRTDIDLNMVTGKGHARGTVYIMPDAYDGTWEGGHFSGPIRNFMFSGRGIDYGTGELEGLKDIVRVQEIDPSELPPEYENPCNGDPVLGAFFAIGKIVGK
ncbi:MAG: hypothetical protein ACK2UK_01960 [Candidatus Promineifilaceae bacterium]|jgi:hypothetical protein